MADDGISLREVLAKLGYPDNADPMQCIFLIVGFMRSSAHREPSTFEGDCAGIVGLMKKTGRNFNTIADIKWLLSHMGETPDIKAPRAFWQAIVDADERDENMLEGQS